MFKTIGLVTLGFATANAWVFPADNNKGLLSEMDEWEWIALPEHHDPFGEAAEYEFAGVWANADLVSWFNAWYITSGKATMQTSFSQDVVTAGAYEMTYGFQPAVVGGETTLTMEFAKFYYHTLYIRYDLVDATLLAVKLLFPQ